MKFIKTALILALLSLPAMVSAGDLHYALGLKYWLADWTTVYTDYTSGEQITTDPESGSMMGFSGSLKKDKIGFNLTFFSGSGWKWEDDYDYYVYWPGYPVDDHYYGSSIDEMKRSDIIAMASYSLNPMFTVFVGYKTVSYKEDYSDEWTQEIYDIFGNLDPLYSGTYSYEDSWDYDGGGMGAAVGLSYPLTASKKLSAFGNLGYFKLGGDIDSGDTIIEAGANWVLTNSLILTGSYRYEGYENDIKLQGISLGLSYFK